MIDQGNGVEIMYPNMYKGFSLKDEDLTKYDTPLVGNEVKQERRKHTPWEIWESCLDSRVGAWPSKSYEKIKIEAYYVKEIKK